MDSLGGHMKLLNGDYKAFDGRIHVVVDLLSDGPERAEDPLAEHLFQHGGIEPTPVQSVLFHQRLDPHDQYTAAFGDRLTTAIKASLLYIYRENQVRLASIDQEGQLFNPLPGIESFAVLLGRKIEHPRQRLV